MAYQINLTGQEIDERLQNIGTDKDVAAADGSLYARISKNADDVDELRDTVGHIDSAQNATDKTVTQHTADISALQTAVGNNKTEQDAIAQKVQQNAAAIGSVDDPNNAKGSLYARVKKANASTDINRLAITTLSSANKKNQADITDIDSRQTNIEKVVSGAQKDAYFTLKWFNLVFSGSRFNGNIDNVKVRLYRWSGKRYAQFVMFTRNGTGVSQELINYEIILKQKQADGANVRVPYIHYNDDGTEEELWLAVNEAFGGRISYNRYKKRRWRIQAFLNDKPITAPFDFRVSIDANNNAYITKRAMMRSVPATRQVKYDGYYNVDKWLNCDKGEELDLTYYLFYDSSKKIRRKFPNPGDVMVKNASSHVVPRGVIISVFQDTPASYCILWADGLSIYEISIDLDPNRGRGYNCYSPAKKLSDNIYGYVSKMNSGTLRDLYISAGAKYNEATGYYELNGLTDITEEQMRVIYEKTWGWWIGLPNLNGFGDSSARTNIPCPDYKRTYYQSNVNLSSSFATTGNLDNLEVLNFIPTQYPKDFSIKLSMSAMNWMCQGNAKPLTIMGTFDVGGVPGNNSLNIGGNIKTINIKNLSKNIKFYGSKVLSKESVLYMINNSAATSAITISLNKAVYDVMKDDADIIAALAEKTNITLIQNT